MYSLPIYILNYLIIVQVRSSTILQNILNVIRSFTYPKKRTTESSEKSDSDDQENRFADYERELATDFTYEKYWLNHSIYIL